MKQLSKPSMESNLMKSGSRSPSGKILRVCETIPFYGQFASPELIGDIIYHRSAAEDDPRWPEFGFAAADEYVYWAWRCCGPACLKSAVEALGGPLRSMAEWVKLGLERKGFIFSEMVGPDKPSGWIHSALAGLAEDSGLTAGCMQEAGIKEISEFIKSSRLIIASVTPELGESTEITKKSGHLVLVHALSIVNNEVEAVCIHNPSGREKELQANAWIRAGRFLKGFSGRLIYIGR